MHIPKLATDLEGFVALARLCKSSGDITGQACAEGAAGAIADAHLWLGQTVHAVLEILEGRAIELAEGGDAALASEAASAALWLRVAFDLGPSDDPVLEELIGGEERTLAS